MSLRFRFLLLSITSLVVLVIVILWNVDRWTSQRFAANAQLFGEILNQAERDASQGLDEESVRRHLRQLADDQARLSSTGLRRQLIFLGFLTAALGAVGLALLAERFVTPVGDVAREVEKLADGDSGADLDLERDDEIGEIARAFDDMASSAAAQVAELSGKSRELQALRDDLEQLSSALEKEQIVPRLLRDGARRLGASEAMLWALDPRSGWIDVFEYDGTRGHARTLTASELGVDSLIGRDDLGDRVGPHLTMGEVDESQTRPVACGGQSLGLLAVAVEGDRSLDDLEIQLVADLARHLGIALENARLYEQAIRDDLTGLYLKRHFLDRLHEEIDRARRYGKPVAVLMADLDHFKRVNDQRGHLSGDRVLREMAQLITASVRSSDVVGRFGGEEIALILPEQELAGALRAAEKVRLAVEGHRFPVADDGPPVEITLSLGVAIFPGDGEDADGLLSVADQALYEAKRQGRNRVCSGAPTDEA